MPRIGTKNSQKPKKSRKNEPTVTKTTENDIRKFFNPTKAAALKSNKDNNQKEDSTIIGENKKKEENVFLFRPPTPPEKKIQTLPKKWKKMPPTKLKNQPKISKCFKPIEKPMKNEENFALFGTPHPPYQRDRTFIYMEGFPNNSDLRCNPTSTARTFASLLGEKKDNRMDCYEQRRQKFASGE